MITPEYSGAELLISPSHYVTGSGALRQVGPIARRYGKRVFILHGETGYFLVADDVLSSIKGSSSEFVLAPHTGPCTHASVEKHMKTATSFSAEVVVGVGGGRVLDVAKGVADLAEVPCITLPTSPATCAASTAVIVFYDSASVYMGSRLVRDPPAAAIVDSELLVQAPKRLLVAGIVDAVAKYHEVRFSLRQGADRTATSLAALALCDGLEEIIGNAATALNGVRTSPILARKMIAETAVLWPGLIGGLAGEASKLAAAHAIHNALTLLPGSKNSLHGEILAFGVLVQMMLEGSPATDVLDKANFFAYLGCPCSLEALGCDAFYAREREVLQRAVGLASMQRSFPNISEDELSKVMREVDEIASESMRSKIPSCAQAPCK